ncbi:MAG: hypothetical protein ACLPWG_01740, partial [Steroidobacteraceae bacterium]
MLKNLLVHIPSEREIRPIIDGAVSLAMTRAAHLDGVSIGFETTPMGFAMDGGAAIAATFEFERERALARANAALAVFETEVRNAGITYGLRPLAGIPAEAAATMGALARLYDLTIVLQPEARDHGAAGRDLPRLPVRDAAHRPLRAGLARRAGAAPGGLR